MNAHCLKKIYVEEYPTRQVCKFILYSSKAPHFNHTKTQSPFKSYIVGSSGSSLTSSPMSFPMAHCAPVTLSFLATPKLHQIASYFRTLAFVLFSVYNVLPQKILMNYPLPSLRSLVIRPSLTL